MAEINILLRATDEASNVIAKAGNNISTSMKVVEETSNQVTKAQQNHEASTKQLALGMNNLATSAFGLYDAVDRVQDMQVTVNRANLQVKSSLNSVEDAQRRYNATVEKYGSASEEANAAAKDLQLAQERYQVATERAEMMQGNLNEAIMQSALTVIPSLITMIANIGRLTDSWNKIKET